MAKAVDINDGTIKLVGPLRAKLKVAKRLANQSNDHVLAIDTGRIGRIVKC